MTSIGSYGCLRQVYILRSREALAERNGGLLMDWEREPLAGWRPSWDRQAAIHEDGGLICRFRNVAGGAL